MSKRRRRLPRQLSDFKHWTAPGVLALALLALTAGFIHFTQISLYKQAYFAPGSEHPDDWIAALCLVLGLIALAGIFLSLREPPPMHWRRGRRLTAGRIYRHGRPKPRRRSGTITVR